MIEPQLSDDSLLQDIRAAEPGDGLCLWGLGQSGFLCKSAKGVVLFDPYLSDSLRDKYAGSQTPHDRMTRLPIDPARLDMIDVVTSSHAHTDHLDGPTLQALRDANPDLRMVIPEATRPSVVQRIGCEEDWPIGMDADSSMSVLGFVFHAVAAAHEKVQRDQAGRHHYLGYVVDFGGLRIYHSGDTVVFEGLARSVEMLAPDIVLLPINGRNGVVAGNMDAKEAAQFARDVNAKLAIPCHYDMFAFNTADPQDFADACGRAGQPYKVLRSGERLHLPAR